MLDSLNIRSSKFVIPTPRKVLVPFHRWGKWWLVQRYAFSTALKQMFTSPVLFILINYGNILPYFHRIILIYIH